MDRKKPIGDDLRRLIEAYHLASHREKLQLAQDKEISYDTLKNWVNQELKLEPPAYKFPKTIPWEEHIRIFKEMDSLTARHQQVPSEITVSIETDLPIAIAYPADEHLGMLGVDYDSFERDYNLIETEPGLYIEKGGDGYQNVIQPSKAGSAHNQIPVANQKSLYVLTLKKVKNKITALRTGNHNYWTQLADGEDWDAELAYRLKLVYTKHFGKIHYRIGDMVYPTLSLHKGRFNSSFNLTHTCKQYQRLYAPDARIVVIEHQHVGVMEQYRYNDNECVALRPGTYAIYDDFAQQQGYFGSHVCVPAVVLFPYEDKLVGFKDMWDAIVYLRAVRQGA